MTEPERCPWCLGHPLYLAYHDEEWGLPLHDDRRLFEMLILEGAQAGLSWLTILKRREGYRAAFDGFDAKAGRRYRDLVLAPGGVGKILDHLTTFLGRPPSQEAFLKSRGIA